MMDSLKESLVTDKTRTTLGVTVAIVAFVAVLSQTFGAQMQRLGQIEREVAEVRGEVREVRSLLMNEFRATREQRDRP